MQTGTERVQNGYKMNIELIPNGYGTDQKKEKAFSRIQTVREHVAQNMC